MDGCGPQRRLCNPLTREGQRRRRQETSTETSIGARSRASRLDRPWLPALVGLTLAYGLSAPSSGGGSCDSDSMNPRIDVITIAVDNLERSLAFYRDGLGLKTEGIIATEFGGDETNAASAVVFFELEGGLKLALYPRSELAKDAGIAALPAGSSGFSIGHLVADKSKVDELLERARAAGAPIS